MPRRKAQPQQNATKIRHRILQAALSVAGHTPWEQVSLLDIAEESGESIATIQSIFPDKNAIVTAIIDALDDDVVAEFPSIDMSLALRDRLFDVLMERLERANHNRRAHLSFFRAFGWTAQSRCADMTLMKKSMTRMADCAGMETRGISATVKLAGLSIVYLWTLLIWAHDESPDLGKTMSALDKALSRFESIENNF